MVVDFAHFNSTFLDAFEETITYGKADDSTREITGVVTRSSELQDAAPASSPDFLVEVPNDEETGISADELDTGADWLEFPARLGEDVKRFRHIELLGHDAGFLQLRVR